MNNEYHKRLEQAAKHDVATLHKIFRTTGSDGTNEELDQALASFHYANSTDSFQRNRGEEWITTIREIYGEWLSENPSGLKVIPYQAPGVTIETIRQVIVGELVHERAFYNYFLFLAEVLSMLGVEIFSPGGSAQRRAWQMLIELFGLEEDEFGFETNEFSDYIRFVKVRVCLDKIADAVITRCARNYRLT